MKTYNLESVQLPSLAGLGLKLFRWAVETPITRRMIMPGLLRDGGILNLRAKRLDEVPTMFPLSVECLPESQKPDDTAGFEDIHAVKKEGMPFDTVHDFSAAYREGHISPLEVAERFFNAVDNSQQERLPLNAFIAIDREDVMIQASASAARWKEGKPLSVLDGVPVAVKDEFDQVPYPTTAGTTFLGKESAREDSTAVARLRAAGALLVGKANMHEIGINPNGLNVHYGTARNPYHLSHDPGGSSSGPAVAVAANLCPVALGADGGGSIRIPAALCGLVGLKGTFGRVSEKGAAPLCWSLAHIGPIGITVEDVALAYAAVAGPDKSDAMSQYQPAVSLKDWNNPDLTGVRLGIYRPWFVHATSDLVSACENALEQLQAAGAKIFEIEIPELDEMRVAQAVSILAEMAASMKNFKEHTHEFADSVRLSLALGNEFTAHDYLQAQRMRTRALNIFRKVYRDVDAIISPTTAIPSPLIPSEGRSDWSDLSTVTELMRFVYPGNLTGLPAISFPVGYNHEGLPLGMHVMARHWEEHLLLQIAYAAEQFVERKMAPHHYRLLG